MEEKDQILMQEATRYVSSIGKWYRFFGILAIIGASLMIFFGIIMILFSAVADYALPYDYEEFGYYNVTRATSSVSVIMGVSYILLSGLMVPVAVFMLRGASAARRSVEFQDNEQAVLFLKNTKSFWKFNGIVNIVMIALVFLFWIAAVVIAAANM